ncbi:class I SAM-dependent methyltransferase [Rhizobium sp. NFR03]|uniref:class I SAM-dependent methyltransferase n=1 Tax=Rhizobium sp. NFR03 TaxID=1566263 RepID=UPI0008C06153|nr:class I SAM-dependent methyltransferase [Rhizobium sp. NFR03]SES11842.1 Methyltransferase domain-containing protein [Rhizobium sp. NFR03]
MFDGHYVEWRLKRVRALVENYGADWFRGRRVLELACGYGDIGASLWTLGADVTFLEGRAEHIDVLRKRMPMLPSNRTIVGNMEDGLKGVGLADSYDLIIHFGVLYHLQDWKTSLNDCLSMSRFLALETEVCDSDDPDFEFQRTETGYDQAVSGVGTRPSADRIEREIREGGMILSRVSDNRCNANIHVYDWPVMNTGEIAHGRRRMWFCGQDRVAP